MAFIAGAGVTNVDLLYQGMERIPDVGEELYCKDFDLQLGGGLPATLINLGRLGIETKIATELGTDIFSEFAKNKFLQNGVEPTNPYVKYNKITGLTLPTQKQKRWGVGPAITAGYDPANNKISMMLGVSLSYHIFEW